MNIKKLSSILTVLMLIAALMSGCANDPIQSDGDKSVTPDSGKEAISLAYDLYNVSGIALENEPDAPNYIGSYAMPYIDGLGDAELADYINGYLADEIQKPAQEFEDDYNDLRTQIANEQDEQSKTALRETVAQYSYWAKTYIVTTSDQYFSVAEPRYENKGGAHPMQYMRVFNVDIAGKRFIKLSDIFNDSGWRATIEKKLNELGKSSDYTDLILPEVEIKVVNENDFYLADGKLFIFFQPSEIGAYAAGFIVFEIPLSDLSEVLKDEYAQAVYKDEMSREQLFVKTFETRE